MKHSKGHKDIFYKMYVKEMIGTFLDKFEHINQVKQFSTILRRVNRTDMTWASHDTEHEAIRKLVKNSAGHPLSKITIKKNINHYVKVGLLLKICKGNYKVNPEYISFGEDEQ